jgi:hypothetical protein
MNSSPKLKFKKVANMKLIVIAILTILPFVYLSAVVNFCKADVPFGDQWDFIPLLEKSYSGTVTIGELFAQHNEHRLFFPRIAMLLLAHQSKWKISRELELIQLISLMTFFLLIYQIYRFLKSNSENSEYFWFYILPLISLLFFNLNQWENWIWGWQIQIVLSIFSAIFGFFILCTKNVDFFKILLSLLLGTISFFSYSSGFLFFLIGMVLLFALKFESKFKKYFYLFFFFIYSATVFILYFYGYKNPENHPPIFGFINQPLEFTKYFFKYLGGALVGPGYALPVGIFGVMIFIVLIIFILKNKIRLSEILFFGSLSLYSIGSALISAVGRSGFGSWQALSPRYCSFSILFWIAIFAFLFKVIELLNFNVSLINNFLITISIISIFVISSLAVRMNVVGTVYSFERKKNLEMAKVEILKGSRNPEILKNIYPPGAFGVERRLDSLKRLQISVFRK